MTEHSHHVLPTTATTDAAITEPSVAVLPIGAFEQHGWQQAWPDDDHAAEDRRLLLTLGMDAYTTTGVIGRPSLATREKGRAALQTLGQNAAKVVEILSGGSAQQ